MDAAPGAAEGKWEKRNVNRARQCRIGFGWGKTGAGFVGIGTTVTNVRQTGITPKGIYQRSIKDITGNRRRSKEC